MSQVYLSANANNSISRKCSECKNTFQINDNDTLNFCPFCAKAKDDNWLTDAQHTYIIESGKHELTKKISSAVKSKILSFGISPKPFPLIEGNDLPNSSISKCCKISILYSEDPPLYCGKCASKLD